MLLIYEKEGCGVHGDAIRGTCAEETLLRSSLWWPNWKTRLTWKSQSYAHFVGKGSVPVFVAMGCFCPVTVPYRTRLIILGTCCKIPDLAHGVFPLFPVLKDHSPGHRFTWWNSWGGGIRSVRPLWQMPKSLSVLLRKVAHQWHIYCVLSFTSIKILPLICM